MMPRLPVNRPRAGIGMDVAERVDAVLQWHNGSLLAAFAGRMIGLAAALSRVAA